MTLELVVNGRRFREPVEPHVTLLRFLRERAGAIDVKYGCGEGQCGACTVLIGAAARRSCQIPVSAAVGTPITTIEGLENDGHLHPVQQAFLEVGAFQCAYCTPGMIMSGVALLETKSNPSAQEIAHSMQGNICRCGTYPRILDALQRAAKAMQEAQP